MEEDKNGDQPVQKAKKIDCDPTDPAYLDHLLDNIDKNAFDPYLKCYICKGFLRDAHTIIECGDTFCKSCVCFYFSSVKTSVSCPVCKEDLGGRPLDHVVPDPSIQKIVDILYPEFKELDIKAINAMYKAFEDEGGLPIDRSLKEQYREIDFSKYKVSDDPM
ncbi:unnamed protein product [Moneuplotes crassus]|uniref:RING-type domain-containing protein n=1 Tax=Euplotes crassus TaxID=5936 RepID=A0AAD1Y4C7_EUPCR|nr:unnamed protein product [Moneuplotes crassus]